MVRFKFSAFSDEYSASLNEQIEGLIKHKIRMTELRGVDDTNVSDLTLEKAGEVHKKLESAGISVSAVGSPIGKIMITDPIEPHLDKLKHTCEIAKILGTSRIRAFSFYLEEGKYEESRNEVIDRIGKMLDITDEYGVKYCHENEKGIYGDSPERCLELLEQFDGRMGCVFDPANFIQCGYKPFDTCYNILKNHITYLHIKDATAKGVIVPAGKGIGGIPEILALINNSHTGDFILTLEPHLQIFKGLEALEGGQKTELGNAYASSAEAFEAAVTNLRYCIPRTAAQI
ncbi:MAG: sugar phosphate isomerase/epimerase [Ruminococcaceae bacterium]|nr:sugar phosphate isomerase/epimerase [Oscillospiraceae bacterium]